MAFQKTLGGFKMIENIGKSMSAVYAFGADLSKSTPSQFAQYGLYAGGIALGGRKCVHLLAAAGATLGSNIADALSENSETNQWFSKQSKEYTQLAKQNLVRDLTLSVAMIGGGFALGSYNAPIAHITPNPEESWNAKFFLEKGAQLLEGAVNNKEYIGGVVGTIALASIIRGIYKCTKRPIINLPNLGT